MQHTQLSDGFSLPKIGFGTDGFNSEAEAIEAIKHAINNGYELIDSATAYGTHSAIREAIQHSKQTVQICTKFREVDYINSSVPSMVGRLTEELGRDHIDILLAHNPNMYQFDSVLDQLIDLKNKGQIGCLGVSNFTIKHLQQIENKLAHIAINQVEFHPYLNQTVLDDYCQAHGVHIMAYRPFCLGDSDLFENPTIATIAQKHQKEPGQIILRWLIQLGMTPIVKARQEQHQLANLAIFDFALSADDMDLLNSLNQDLRTCTGEWADF